MTADPWHGPACQVCAGKGEIVFTRGNHWVSVRCEDCHGTGLADAPGPSPRYDADGFKIPEDGEEYDPDVHGPPPQPPAWLRRDA